LRVCACVNVCVAPGPLGPRSNSSPAMPAAGKCVCVCVCARECVYVCVNLGPLGPCSNSTPAVPAAGKCCLLVWVGVHVCVSALVYVTHSVVLVSQKAFIKYCLTKCVRTFKQQCYDTILLNAFEHCPSSGSAAARATSAAGGARAGVWVCGCVCVCACM